MKKEILNTLLIVCLAAVLVSTARAQTNTVNNADLKGDYAFSLMGFSASSGSSVFSAAGRFRADGAGNLTNGELDTNGAGLAAPLVAQAFTGTYSIGADHRGVMTLTTAQGGSSRLAFAMIASGNAQVIEFDASGGTGVVASGTIEKANTAAYSTARIKGNYAFGIAGYDPFNRRVTFVGGRLTADGAGNFTNGVADINASDAAGPATFTAANYNVSDTATGRGTINVSIIFAGKPFSLSYVFYIVNSGEILVMGRDAVATTTPLLSGTLLQQQTPLGGFSNASLSGGMVLSLTSLTVCVSTAVPDVALGVLSADGNGNITLSYDRNCGGVVSSEALSGTYSVTSDGRAAITIGTVTLVAYLASRDQAFFVATNGPAFFGFSAPQTGSFTNKTISSTFAGVTTLPAPSAAVTFSGEFTADGVAPIGTITGTEDTGGANGPVSGSPFSATYSIASSPINGRGVMTITSGSGGSAVLYVISPTRFLAIPLSDPNPALWTFERLHP